MKHLVFKSVLFLLVTIIGSSVFYTAKAQSKQTNPKVFAVINRADWCPACQANEGKVMREVMPACNKLNVKFIANDLTNEQTTLKSANELKKHHLFASIKESKTTGIIILINAKTGKVIKELSITKPSAELIQEITIAQS
ncbi:MAG: hypothetical protein Q8R50_09970 [Sediminibacterium sp.]|nr:hypothetical protein [Sediminibacterium sp.]